MNETEKNDNVKKNDDIQKNDDNQVLDSDELSPQDIKKIKKRLKQERFPFFIFCLVGLLFVFLGGGILANWIKSIVVMWGISDTSELIGEIAAVIFSTLVVGVGIFCLVFGYRILKLKRDGNIALKYGKSLNAQVYTFSGVRYGGQDSYSNNAGYSIKYKYELDGVSYEGRTTYYYTYEEAKYLKSQKSIKIRAYKNKSVMIEVLPSIKYIKENWDSYMDQDDIARKEKLQAKKEKRLAKLNAEFDRKREELLAQNRKRDLDIFGVYYVDELSNIEPDKYSEDATTIAKDRYQYSRLLHITQPRIPKTFCGQKVTPKYDQLFVPKDKDSYYIFSQNSAELFDRYGQSLQKIQLQYPYKYDFANASKWEISIFSLCGHKFELKSPNNLTYEFELLIKSGYIKQPSESSINHEFERLIEEYYEYQELIYEYRCNKESRGDT